MKNNEEKEYIFRTFYSADGFLGGILETGRIVAGSFIKRLTDAGASIAKDAALNASNNWKYSYYRLYLKDGSFALLQDLDYTGTKIED